MSHLLLDTCAVLWIARDERISEAASTALDGARAAGEPVRISPISAWEVALLVARNRIALPLPPEIWFDRLLQAPGVVLAEMPPSVLIASAFLPRPVSRDPSDRIIAATARHFGYTIVTRDRLLLAYAQAGHVRAIGC